MKAVRDAFRRVCLGTGHELEWLGWWLSAESHVPERHTLRTDLPWLGRILLRAALAVVSGIFWAQLLGRNPYFMYAVPFVWSVSAWRMSDWSATPPPRGLPLETVLPQITRVQSREGLRIRTGLCASTTCPTRRR